MDTWALCFLAVASVQCVLGSYFHGPTAKPVVLKSGYLADTHEVAAAKGAHLAALAKESHYGHGGDYSGSYGGDYLSYDHGHVTKYHGPTAKPVVLKSGYLADTHEVAAAKGAHLAALAKKSHYGYGGDHSGSYEGGHSGSYGYGGDYNHGHDIKYHGPIAIPHVLKNGHIADTHEVAVAKAEHYDAVSKAKAHSGYGYAGDYGYGHGGSYGYSQGGLSGSHGGVYDHSYGHGHVTKYHGPTAKPVVLKSGYLADTHEVAAAKGAHLAALSKQSHYGHGYAGDVSGAYGYAGDYSESYGYAGDHSGSRGYGHAYSHGHNLKYHGPTAIPHVLKNGHIADTHDVAAAKAEHYAAVAGAKSHGGYGYGYDGHGSHGYSSHY